MNALSDFFAALGVLLAVPGIIGGIVLVVREMNRAPDGHQDATGYHSDEPVHHPDDFLSPFNPTHDYHVHPRH